MKKYILKVDTVPKQTKIDYRKELNEEQYKVVTEGEGPCLVLAGAGSGKTRTLVYRTAYLLERGVKPQNIMLVTFTNKAAREMLNRVEVLLKYRPKGLWGGTFHHIGNMVLRKYGQAIDLPSTFNILDAEDSKSLLRAVLGELNVNTKQQYFPKVNVMQSIISFAVNSQTDIRQLLKTKYSYIKPEMASTIVNIAERYHQKKRKSYNLDFDDLLAKWLELIESTPEMHEQLSSRLHYVLVDEYQDTNHIQGQIVTKLAEVHKNILVVGDDSQSIYSFRAADVNNIMRFPKIFKKTKIYKLTTNYRSSPEILRLANESIARNRHQFKKKLHTSKSSRAKPALVTLQDAEQQAEFVAQRVLELQEEGSGLQDMAVLFRSTYHSLELELELNKRNIPYQVRGGLRFFEQAHIKDVISFLKVLANPKDEVAWSRVLGLWPGIGPATAFKIWGMISTAADFGEITELSIETSLPAKPGRSWRQIRPILTKMQEVGPEHPSQLMQAALEFGYKDYLKEAYENFKERGEDLEQLINFSSQYESLEKFLADAALSEGFKGERVNDVSEAEEEYLVLSTIHQAKGLEWPVVILIGLVDGQFPHYKVHEKPEELEEERRLFYVAVTRAKDELYLTQPIINFSFTTGRYMNQPSRFVKELPKSSYEKWQIAEEAEEVIDIDDL
jgi:DNA helicase II / ATP-dependent DNA helicase PcrA